MNTRDRNVRPLHRAYIPQSLWPEVREMMLADLKSFRMGGVEDFRNFINAVIDEAAFDKLAGFIDQAKTRS